MASIRVLPQPRSCLAKHPLQHHPFFQRKEHPHRFCARLGWPHTTALSPPARCAQRCKFSIDDSWSIAKTYIRPQGLFFEMMFGAAALAVGAAVSLTLGGALFAGAITAAIVAATVVVGSIAWIGLVITVALPAALLLGGVAVYMVNRMSQSEEGKRMMEEARKEADEFERKNFGTSFVGRDRESKVIDIKADLTPEEATELKRRMQEVDEELSEFDRRLRNRF